MSTMRVPKLNDVQGTAFVIKPMNTSAPARRYTIVAIFLRLAQHDPRIVRTATTVLNSTQMSIHGDQFRMYWASRATRRA